MRVFRKDMPLGVVYNAAHLGGHILQKPILGCELASSSQTREYKDLHIIESTALIPAKFCTTTKTTKYSS